MTTVDLHPSPSFGTAFRAHLRTLYYTLRSVRWLVGLALLVAGIGTFAFARAFGRVFLPADPVLQFLFVVVVTFRVWRAESPAQRMYFWAMPLGRGEHTLAKVFAGWCWLVGFVALSTIVSAVAGKLGILYSSVPQLADSHTLVEPIANDVLSVWIAPFMTVTVLYFLVTIFTVLFESPGYWLGGFCVGMLFIPALLHSNGWNWAADTIQSVWLGRYGLARAIEAPAVGDASVLHWWVVTGLWIAIGIVATIVAASSMPGSVRVQRN